MACDIESVVERPADEWDGLLGPRMSTAELVVTEAEESLEVAGTRVWSAGECLTKAGIPPDAPLTMTRREGAWVIFASGELEIATFVTTLRGVSNPVVFAVLAEGRS